VAEKIRESKGETDPLRLSRDPGNRLDPAGLVRPALVAPGQQTEASRVFALYTFARTIPVALVTIAAILWAR
jgi:hypothetical protein